MTTVYRNNKTRGKMLLDTLRQGRPTHLEGEVDGEFPLTLAQHTLLASQDLHPNIAVANVSHAWDLHGLLDATALQRAFGRLVQRHDAMRMSITRDKGHYTAFFADRLDCTLPCEIVDGRDTEARLVSVNAQIEQAALTSLPLGANRLWTARLFRIAKDHHVLAVTMHHLICDDWSWRILLRDLFTFYQSETTGTEPDLPHLSSFRSYLAQHRAAAEVATETIWPEIDWPTSNTGLLEQQAVEFECVETNLVTADFNVLKQAARVNNCTPFTFFLASYHLLLSLYCDQLELGVSSSVADRTTNLSQQCIGALIRDLQLGVSLSGLKSFSDLLRACSTSVQSAQASPDEQINLGRATIGYYNAPEFTLPDCGITVKDRNTPKGVTAINLHLDLVPSSEGVRILLKGQRRHFNRQQLDSLLNCFVRIVTQVIRTPFMDLADIALTSGAEALTQAERSVNLSPLPEGDAIDCFTAIARSHPMSIALETPVNQQSYLALEEETNALAHWLHEKGLVEGDRIGVLAPRGSLVFKVWIAALKAGLVVVPMDIELTEARLSSMLQEARCQWVISPKSAHRVETSGVVTFLTPPSMSEQDKLPVTPPIRKNKDPRRVAFVMFTSGTTGTPKSIPISHQALIRLALGGAHLPVGPGDRLIQLASPGFDGSFIELWGAWLKGATLVLCEKPVLAEGGLAAEFQTLAPTASFMTTSLFNTMVDTNPGLLAKLRYLAIGGEAASPSHCRRALERNSHLVLSNGYGPTENTGFTTTYHVHPEDSGASVPIGRPLPNNIALVLSRYLTPVPDGFAGELLVGGAGLASGYENQPELSAERFINKDAKSLYLPLEGSVTLYRTGDRTRWNCDREIEFLGRRDSQFKLHGHRIEPSEVEAAIMEFPAIGRVGVIPDFAPGQDHAVGILAFVEDARNAKLDEYALRAFLTTRLPRSHRPTRYIQSSSIPLTKNGKTDVRALVELRRADADAEPSTLASQDQLTAIWQKVLNRSKIPENVDFYALGGTSLSLVRMLLEVEEQLEIEIDFADISDDPTLEKLRILVANCPQSSRGDLKHLRVLKQGNPTLPPLVLMPTANGASAWAVDIVSRMRAPNTVLAMTFDLSETTAPHVDWVSGLLDKFLQDIRAYLGGKPIAICGYSFGGALGAYLAGRAEALGVSVTQFINIDGGCPNGWVAPGHTVSNPQDGLFDDWFRLYPAKPIEVPTHLVTTERRFPLSRQNIGASWARLTKQETFEYVFDTHHALLPKPPIAEQLAKCLDRILKGTMPPTRILPAQYSEKETRLLNRIKSLSRSGRLDDASKLLDNAFTAQNDAPEWMALGLIQLAQMSSDEARLNELRKLLAPSTQSPAVLNALLKNSGDQWQGLLWQAYKKSGPDMNGAVPLLTQLMQNGQEAKARQILRKLETSRRHQIEAAIARSVVIAFTQGAKPATQRMLRALSGNNVGPGHIRWCAQFLAKQGEIEAARKLLHANRTRFPRPMQEAIEKINQEHEVNRQADTIGVNSKRKCAGVQHAFRVSLRLCKDFLRRPYSG